MKRNHKTLAVTCLLTLLLISSSLIAAPYLTSLVSTSNLGVQGNSDSWESYTISADGKLAAFTSAASNLVPNDTNNAWDVFVKNTQTGEITIVSVSSSGVQGDLDSYQPAISADGKFVAFVSDATNLVANDTNDSSDIFLYEIATKKTNRISISTAGVQADGSSYTPSISADGKFVGFESYASNLVASDINNCEDVFVRNIQSNTTTRVSTSTSGTESDNDSSTPSLSADGRYIAFSSWAANLVSNDTDFYSDIFVKDLQTGQTIRASQATSGTQADSDSFAPSITADGRYVAFYSWASNLVANETNNYSSIFVHDNIGATTVRISGAANGSAGDDDCYSPSISGNGKYIVFESYANNLTADVSDSFLDVFVYESATGNTAKVSAAPGGGSADSDSFMGVISADGSSVFYTSDATNLVAGDTNGFQDVFLYSGGAKPEIKILSPTTGTSIKDDFTISGSCKSDVDITSVDIESKGVILGSATLSPDKLSWTFSVKIADLDLGDTPIIATVTDSRDNTNTDQIMVKVQKDKATVAVSLDTGQLTPTDKLPIKYKIKFSEVVTGFNVDKVQTTGTATVVQKSISGSGDEYILSLSDVSSNGSIIVNVPADAALDYKGQGNLAAPAPATVDYKKLSIKILSPTNGGIVTGDFTLSGSYDSISAINKITIESNSVKLGDAVIAADKSSWSMTINASSMPTGSIPLKATVYDVGGKTAVDQITVNYQDAIPSVTVSVATVQVSPTSKLPINFAIKFSEKVSGFTASDVLVSGTAGGVQTALSGSIDTYTLSVTSVSTGGTIIISVPAGVALDSKGQGNSASAASGAVTFKPLSIKITSPSNGTAFKTDFVINGSCSSATAITKIDIESKGKSIGQAVLSANKLTWSFSAKIADLELGDTPVKATATDSEGNTNYDQITVKVQDDKPTVAITLDTGQLTPTDVLPVKFKIKFSEIVTDFIIDDIKISGTATIAQKSISGSGDEYILTISDVSANGSIIVNVPADVALDSRKQGNLAAPAPATVEYKKLNVKILSPSNAAVFKKDFVVSGSCKSTSAITSIAIESKGKSLGMGVLSSDKLTWSLNVKVADLDLGDIPIKAVLTDSTGAAVSDQISVTVQDDKPTVTASIAAGQATPTGKLPINFKLKFSEVVTGFTASDVLVSGTAGGVQTLLSGSGTDYTLSVTALSSNGTIMISIPAGGAQDSRGQGNLASAVSAAVTYKPLSVKITSPVNGSQLAGNFKVMGTCDSVSNITKVEIYCNNKYVGDAGLAGDKKSWSIGINFAILSLINNTLKAIVYDDGGSSTSDLIAVSAKDDKPVVTITRASGQSSPTSVSPVKFNITFSEPVTGFSANGVNISGTAETIGKSLTGSGSSYVLTVNGVYAAGTIIADVAADSAFDIRNQGNFASDNTNNTNNIIEYIGYLFINKPSGDDNYTSNAKVIDIGGVYDTTISNIKWFIDIKRKGSCSKSKGIWKKTKVSLLLGDNTIVVTGTDKKKVPYVDTLIVKYVDITPPTLKISFPSSKGAYSTKKDYVYVSGSAKDLEIVSKVGFKNLTTGQSGYCLKTTSWKTDKLNLAAGINQIQITAEDNSGNKSTSSIIVTRTL